MSLCEFGGVGEGGEGGCVCVWGGGCAHTCNLSVCGVFVSVVCECVFVHVCVCVCYDLL